MSHPGDRTPDEYLTVICSAYIPDILTRENPRFRDRPPIARSERLAFPHPNSLKRAALFADRVYMPVWAIGGQAYDIPPELTFGDPDLDRVTHDQGWLIKDVVTTFPLDSLLATCQRGPLTRYSEAYPDTQFVPMNYDVGTPVVPAGSELAYQGVLENVPVAIEEALTWPQIAEFRSDVEARRKYRDLHLWLERGLQAESERQAADLIAQQLDDYRWAIRKHGIGTAIEAVASLVSLSAIVPSAGGMAAEAMRLDPMSGALIGGSLAVIGSGAWVAKRLLDLRDLKRGKHREVAYLYDVQKLVT